MSEQTKFKNYLSESARPKAEENLEEAVQTGQGRVEHATVTFNEVDGMFIQTRNNTYNLDIPHIQMKMIMNGKSAKSVPFIKQ